MAQGNHSLTESPRATILRIMLEQGRSTRAELGQRTGLSRSAVAKWVAGLVEEGLVAEAGPEAKGPGTHRGRRSSVLTPVWPAGHVAGIDFGHSHVRVAVADLSGTVLAEQSADADVDNNARNVLSMAAQMIDDLLAAIGADLAGVRDVVAGIPGPIDRSSLTVRPPAILSDWVGLAPAAELERLLGRPVHIENDADLGAWGEARHGAGRGLEHMLYIKASHGIGAGLVLNGSLYRGAHGFAGEIGHTLLEQDGAWCRCGNRGCLETVVSSSQVRRQLRATGRQDQQCAAALAAHDAVSRRVLCEAGRVLGRVTAGLCNLLNPEAVIVGGELGLGGDPVLTGVRESIGRCAQPATAEAVNVAGAMLGLRAEVLGAVTMAASRARQAFGHS